MLSMIEIRAAARCPTRKRHRVRVFTAALLSLCLARSLRADEHELPRFALQTGHHVLPVSAIAGSADGRLVATAAPDRTVRVWSAESGKLLETHWLPDAVEAPPVIGLRFAGDGLL